MISFTIPGISGVDLDYIDPLGGKFTTIGQLITVLLDYVYPIAGLILFGYLILGGFSLLTSGGNPEKIKAGQTKITSAIVGFLIIFVSYWIIQIIQAVLGLDTIF